ncbi:Dinucleoside triphosphate hydrolase [Knufia obscura]|uniref:Bis(5'-adenosyl)-triphosphatase n=1 Tax=Knufia obscura TaxID=1635080 RepID=A0ABR0REA4_9EURO|nr:Dinucleoside triphosphate hydrolase [Knufia obscura]
MTDTPTESTNTFQPPPTDMRLPPLKLPPNLTFGPFPITPSQAFHISPSTLSYALVNLRPLLPGHTLICPVRRVPRLSQLSDNETTDLFLTVKRVSRMLERVYKADALNVAVQDGVEAGQSVNHVHVHVIPRRKGDVVVGDQVYERMDGREGNVGAVWEEYEVLQGRRKGEREISGGPDGEEGRVDRSEEEMREEAQWLRWEMEREAELEEMRKQSSGADETPGGEIP